MALLEIAQTKPREHAPRAALGEYEVAPEGVVEVGEAAAGDHHGHLELVHRGEPPRGGGALALRPRGASGHTQCHGRKEEEEQDEEG